MLQRTSLLNMSISTCSPNKRHHYYPYQVLTGDDGSHLLEHVLGRPCLVLPAEGVIIQETLGSLGVFC